VRSEEQPEAGRFVELPEVGETRTTDAKGVVEFLLPADDYIVRAYDINTGGPGRPVVEISLAADVGETTRVAFLDYSRCAGPGAYLNLSE